MSRKGVEPSGNALKSPNHVIPTSHLKALVKGKVLQLTDFDLRSTVGTGTFGRVRVVKMKGSQDQTPLAMKILKKSEAIRLKQVEHIKAERQILQMIEHPFIVNLVTTFQDERRLFMLMEFVNGGELFSFLRKRGRLNNDQTRFFAAEIVLALTYLHAIHIVYRDLKPENLLIDCEGHIKMTDFGFAKVVEDRTWTLCGTAEYLAPEIIQSKGHGKAVDWWAFGILLFEMLAGYPPFFDDSPFGTYQKVLAGVFEVPRHFDSKVKDLIRKFLVLDKTKRFGCLKAGAEDVKRHKWFKNLDWDMVLSRQVPALHVPDVRGPDDTSMFDRYAESTEASAPAVSAKDQELFEGFDQEQI